MTHQAALGFRLDDAAVSVIASVAELTSDCICCGELLGPKVFGLLLLPPLALGHVVHLGLNLDQSL